MVRGRALISLQFPNIYLPEDRLIHQTDMRVRKTTGWENKNKQILRQEINVHERLIKMFYGQIA